MSEDNGTWRFQLSVKINGTHLLNLRAVDAGEFAAQLAWAEEHKEPLLIACAALEGVRTPERSAPSATPGQGPQRAQKATSAEIGPVGINGVDTVTTKRDGTPMKSPKYAVKFTNGKALSTFDSLIADAAKELASKGSMVYYTTVQNGEYVNLGTVRGA